MIRNLALVLLLCGLGFSRWAAAQDSSGCDSASTDVAVEQLKAMGGVEIGKIEYDVVTSQWGATKYWKTVVANKYQLPNGTMLIATCKGILTKNLKKGPISIVGDWFDVSTESRSPWKRTFVGKVAQTVVVKDYTLSRFGEEVVLVDAEVVVPTRERFDRGGKAPRLACFAENEYFELCTPVLGAQNLEIVLDGVQIQSSGFTGRLNGSGQLESFFARWGRFVFEAGPSVIDSTKTVEVIQAGGEIKLSPSLLEYKAGEALQFKVVNKTPHRIFFNGAITPTFLNPSPDQVVLTSSAPGTVTAKLPWAKDLYLELRTK